jgi:hypothetical protein
VLRWSSLDGVREPTPVELRGRIVTPDRVKSPVTGRRAALWMYYLYARGPRDPFDVLVASGTLGDSVVLAFPGGDVRVHLGRARVYFATVNPAGIELTATPLEGLTDAPGARERIGDRRLYYRELGMGSGHMVRLRATVAPLRAGGAYRSPADAAFVVRDDLEVPTLSADVAELAA